MPQSLLVCDFLGMKPLHAHWRSKEHARNCETATVGGGLPNTIKCALQTAQETSQSASITEFNNDVLGNDILAVIENFEGNLTKSHSRKPGGRQSSTGSLKGSSTPNNFSSAGKAAAINLSPITPATFDKVDDACTRSSVNMMATPDPHLLCNWGLPSEVVSAYESRGLVRMFPWQVQCLTLEGVLSSGANLVYSAPTSAGKTLVAEILMLKRVLETHTRALIVLPFVSVAREKMHSLQALFQKAGLKIGGYMGNHRPAGGLSSVDIAVCTIEKANSLINRLVEEGSLNLLGTVVIDELHMVGDASRGYLLELLLTKVMYMQQRAKSEDHRIQVIGMSATLPNLQSLARWLNASLLSTDFRPVPLKEMFKVGTEIHVGPSLQHLRSLVGIPEASLPNDPEQLLYLCLETLMAGHALLVFCPTKKWCESLATALARCIFDLGRQVGKGVLVPAHEQMGERLRQLLNPNRISDVLDQLRQTPAGLDAVLASTVSYGVAFHHAGLTMDERDVVEGAFRHGVLKVVVATSTLSSGVNLPARRVVIRTPMFHGAPIDMLTYKQMVGRAGRKGIDTEGESILMCKESERNMAKLLSSSELKPIRSCLGRSSSGLSSSLKRAILEVIASGVASTLEDLVCYTRCTLLHALIQEERCNSSSKSRDEKDHKEGPMHDCIQFLIDNEFIHHQGDGDVGHYAPTQLGRAVLASSLSPDEGLCVLQELQQARKSFVLENDLHLIYQVTPIKLSSQLNDVDWARYQDMWERLPPDKRRVADLVGIEERFLMKAATGRMVSAGPRQARALAVHLRFYVALALDELVQEVPLPDVAAKYGCPKGLLQSLQQSAATYAGMVSIFCQRLGWRNMELLVSQFQARLHFGVQPELCELLRLPSLDGRLARLLYDAKHTDPASLAQLQPRDLELLLKNLGPFQSEKNVDDNRQRAQNASRRRFWLVGHAGLTELEAAEIIVNEARSFVEESLGAKVQWASSTNTMKKADSTKEDNTALNAGVMLSKPASPLQDLTQEGMEATEQPISGTLNVGQHLPEAVQEEEIHMEESSSFQSLHNYHPEEGGQPEGDSISAAQPCEGTSEDASEGCLQKSQQQALEQEEQNGQDDLEDIGIDSPRWLCFSGDSLCDQSLHTRKQDELRALEQDKTGAKCKQWNTGLKPFPSDRNKQLKERAKMPCTYTKPAACGMPRPHMACRTTKSLTDHVQQLCIGTADAEVFEIGESLYLDTQTVQALDGACDEPAMGKTHQVTPRNGLISKLAIKGGLCASTVQQNANMQAAGKRDLLPLPESEDLFPAPHAVSPKAEHCQSLTESEKELFSAASSPLLLGSPDKHNKSKEHERPMEQNEQMSGHTSNQAISPTLWPSLSFGSSFERSGSKRSSSSDSSTETLPKLRKQSSDCEMFPSSNTDVAGSPRPANKTDQLPCPAHTVQCGTLLEKFCVVNAAENRGSLARFSKEWKRRSCFALWLAMEELSMHHPTDGGIGLRKSLRVKVMEGENVEPLVVGTKELVGFAVFWGGYRVHYLKLKRTCSDAKSDCCPTRMAGASIANTEILQLVESMLKGNMTIVIFGALSTFKVLNAGCGLRFDQGMKWEDPMIAHWLLDTAATETSLSALTAKWSPHLTSFLNGEVTLPSTSRSKPQAEVTSGHCTCVCAARACVALYHVNHAIKAALRDTGLSGVYEELEMPVLVPLAKMDLNGVGFSEKSGEKARCDLQHALDSLSAEVHKLAGQAFPISSLKATNRVIHRVLGPLVQSDNNAELKKLVSAKKSLTSKEMLLQLSQFHALPRKIVDWRKISSIISRNLNPILRNKTFNQQLSMYRIYTTSDTFTATGRVTMHEPNLQAVARDFEAGMNDPRTLCLRDAFIPFAGSLLLSADYSQLELRLLAHFSRDEHLCAILKKGGDLFKDMAARLKGIDVSHVTDPLRQQAKQVCYGIVYGRGCKSLAEELGIDRSEAEKLVADFRHAFPGAYSYTEKVIQQCRSHGYVTTLQGRKRLLPQITCNEAASRSHAERQAVNTTIQGSAADLLKNAILAIHSELLLRFPESCYTHRTKGAAPVLPTSGAFLVLQLHDELIYEVCLKDLHHVARIVKCKMEAAAQLAVPLVVNIKTGLSWGSLHDYEP